MIAQTLVQKQKKKKASLEQEIPREFREDCKVFSIDFDKLQPKVDKVFDKWIDKENPKTKQPYTEKTVAKWIRFMMKEAGYSSFTIWKVLKENHPNVIQQGHKSFRKPKTSDVTTGEEQEPAEIWQIDPKEYMIDDLDKYDHALKNRIIIWLDAKVNRVMKGWMADGSKMENLEAENKRLKTELTKLQKEVGKK